MPSSSRRRDRKVSKCRMCRRSPLWRIKAISASSWITHGQRRCSLPPHARGVDLAIASGHQISPDIPTYCLDSVPPIQPGGRGCERPSISSPCAPDRRTFIWHPGFAYDGASLARSRTPGICHGAMARRAARSERRARIRPCPPIRAMQSGNVIFSAPQAFSRSFSILCRKRQWRHSSTPCNYSAWVIPGAAMKASSSRSTAVPIARPPAGRLAVRRCVCSRSRRSRRFQEDLARGFAAMHAAAAG